MESNLLGIDCQGCGMLSYAKTVYCPNCGSLKIQPKNLDKNGEIFTFTIVRRGFGRMKDRAPYGLLTVLSADGCKILGILSNNSNLSELKIGKKVVLESIDEQSNPTYRFI